MKKAASKPGKGGSIELRPVAEAASAGLLLRANGECRGGRVVGDVVQEIVSFKDLPRGVWMSNIPWDETRLIEREPLVLIQSRDWLHIPWNDLLEEWSIEPGRQLLAANLLVRVVSRVAQLVLKTSDAMGKGSKKGFTGSERIFEHPSLLHGVRRELEARLSESFPREKRLCAPAKNMYLVGARPPILGKGQGDRIVTARLPQFSHLLEVASQPVPAPGNWYSCSLPKKSPEDILDDLRSLGRPVICEGVFRPGGNPCPSWVAAWISGNDPVFGRRHFSLEEIDIISRYGEFLLHSAYAGSGWSPEGDSISARASAALARICGGDEGARLSWSAGVAAEIFLCAEMSLSSNSSDCPSLESVWTSLADRIAMIPAIEAAEKAGTELVSACAGRLRLRVPESPEALEGLARSLWRAGAVAPGAHSGRIDGNFGGSKKDELFARCQQCSSKRAAWLLDCVMDAAPETRGERFKPAKRAATRLLEH